jgi:hypothetical protein
MDLIDFNSTLETPYPQNRSTDDIASGEDDYPVSWP